MNCARARLLGSRAFSFVALAACAKTNATPDGTILPPIAVPVASTPSASASAATPAERGVIVELLADDDVTIDGEKVSGDAVRDAFAKKTPEETVIIHAAADDPWRRVILVLDLMKQARNGDRPFVLTLKNDAVRRTAVMRLPKASSGLAPPVAPRPGEPLEMSDARVVVSIVIPHDGTSLVNGEPAVGSLRDRLHRALQRGEKAPLVIIRADAQARCDRVIDAARDAQAEGAQIAFAVSPVAPPVASAGDDLVGSTVGVVGGPDPTRPRPKSHDWAKCPFPAAADKAQIDEATAVVRVKVDATGKISAVTIVMDPGHGFGVAAKACAAKAPFEPARDPSGKAIASEATIRVRFAR